MLKVRDTEVTMPPNALTGRGELVHARIHVGITHALPAMVWARLHRLSRERPESLHRSLAPQMGCNRARRFVAGLQPSRSLVAVRLPTPPRRRPVRHEND